MTEKPPPGWYADPHGQPLQRFWDGNEWTVHAQAYPDPYQVELLRAARSMDARDANRYQMQMAFLAVFVAILAIVVTIIVVANN